MSKKLTIEDATKDELIQYFFTTESCEIWWALKALSERPTGEWLCDE